MKVYEKARLNVQDILAKKGSPQTDMTICIDLNNLYTGWYIDAGTITETLRALGFPVLGHLVYNLDE